MPAKKPPEGYISTTHAAKIAGVQVQTIRNWIDQPMGLPCLRVKSGSMTFSYIKPEDLEAFLGRTPKRGRPKDRLYEIVLINCGELTVLFKTKSLMELSHKYTYMVEHGHKLIRIREDGRLLRIWESDKLGNTYHPRTKRGDAV